MAKKVKNAAAAPAAVTESEAASPVVEVVETQTEFFDATTGKSEPATAAQVAEVTPTSNAGPANYVETDPTVQALSNSGNALVREKAKLLTDVGRLGRDNGNGKRSLVALVERVVEASNQGVCGTDDAERIYKKFRDEAAKSGGALAAAEQDDASMKVQVSKLRRFIEVGKGFDDPWTIFEMARDMHTQAMACDDKKDLRVKSTYEALVSVARRQLDEERKGVPLTEEDIRDVLFKPAEDKKETTALDMVKAALKSVMHAIEGRKASGEKAAREPLHHDNLLEAEAHLKQVIADLDPEFFAEEEKKRAEAEEKARKAAEKVMAAYSSRR